MLHNLLLVKIRKQVTNQSVYVLYFMTVFVLVYISSVCTVEAFCEHTDVIVCCVCKSLCDLCVCVNIYIYIYTPLLKYFSRSHSIPNGTAGELKLG